jgi:hypothetical protein
VVNFPSIHFRSENDNETRDISDLQCIMYPGYHYFLSPMNHVLIKLKSGYLDDCLLLFICIIFSGALIVSEVEIAQLVKRPPTGWMTRVRFPKWQYSSLLHRV